ncbi:DUF4241 domain-containing protein [Streptomyces erythrochromogenes]|uniref:DUF4241 domain-containing protein n=1 Tax=Streptomyces erythrochromogenes TaxID=285574 RepID=UPI00382FD588|nr:DUF4241 domain-containing protein [Streptomyces erythrochromogenes]
MPMTPPDYAWHFTPGSAFAYENGTTGTLVPVVIGDVTLPTGRIVACDPFVLLGSGDAEPFAVTVAPGRYRAEAAIATLVRPDTPQGATPHTRVAAARLVIRDTPAVSWEMAVDEGQDPAVLGEGEFYGYGVDAGTGCFYDAAADGSFPGTEEEEGAVWAAMETVGDGPAVFLAGGEDGHTLAGFTSGWGDGCYPTWIGRDAEGRVTCFVTDFFVVPPQEGASA